MNPVPFPASAFRRLLLVLLMLCSCWRLNAQDPQTIQPPESFQNLMNALQGQLKSFSGVVPPAGHQKLERLTVAAEVSTADAILGPKLLTPLALKTALMELEQLRKIGVTAAILPIRYPLLCGEAHRDGQELEAYFQFYRYLVGEARKRKMKVIIAYGCLPKTAQFSDKPVRRYYRQLAYERFKRERWTVLRSIIQELQPDMVGLGSDYQQMAAETGFPLDEPGAPMDAVNACLKILEAGNARKTSKIGAGVLVTQPGSVEVAKGIAEATAADFIDIGIPAVNKGLLRKALEIIDAVKTVKPVAITEAYLSKATDEETGQLHAVEIKTRGVFSFWSRLDQQFNEILIRLACWKDFEFIAVSNGGRLFAYLPFSPESAEVPPEKRYSDSMTAVNEAIVKASLSETGKALKQFLAP